jgi:hypothetical protein
LSVRMRCTTTLLRADRMARLVIVVQPAFL